jgi:membrane protease YdiL (CAAX protease family)
MTCLALEGSTNWRTRERTGRGHPFLPVAVDHNSRGRGRKRRGGCCKLGVSEETLFRGLIMGLLARVFGGTVRLGLGRAAIRVSVAGILAAAIFAFAHTIAYSRLFFLPFSFEPDWLQVVEAFIFGIYYAALREKTGSLLGAIVSHNISDGLYMAMTFLAVAVAH